MSYWLLPGPVPQQANRTTGTSLSCTWPLESWERCGQAAVGELRANYGAYPWSLCAFHMDPELHDPDIREFLVRWKNGVS